MKVKIEYMGYEDIFQLKRAHQTMVIGYTELLDLRDDINKLQEETDSVETDFEKELASE